MPAATLLSNCTTVPMQLKAQQTNKQLSVLWKCMKAPLMSNAPTVYIRMSVPMFNIRPCLPWKPCPSTGKVKGKDGNKVRHSCVTSSVSHPLCSLISPSTSPNMSSPVVQPIVRGFRWVSHLQVDQGQVQERVLQVKSHLLTTERRRDPWGRGGSLTMTQ